MFSKNEIVGKINSKFEEKYILCISSPEPIEFLFKKTLNSFKLMQYDDNINNVIVKFEASEVFE